MIKEFGFEAEGRKYSCTVEERRGTKGEFWWWFEVTGDAQSYAPFQTAKDDTRASVQERVVQFYTNRLFRLSQPSQHGSQWKRREVIVTADPAPEATA